MPVFEIICLANSRKLSGRCVAGIKTQAGEWIRPVGPDRDGTLFSQHYTLDNGTKAQILDLLRIDFVQHRPEPHQPENWVIGQRRWRLLRRPAVQDIGDILRSYIDSGPILLGNTSDRISFHLFRDNPAQASLALITPEDIEWRITRSVSGNRQTRAIFGLDGTYYDLVVTDPVWEARLSGFRYGYHPVESTGLQEGDEIFFTISLGEPFEGSCYKLVAAVIVLSRSF